MSLVLTPRKVTEAERDLMRRHGQWSEIFVALDQAATVYTAVLDLTKPPAGNPRTAVINVVGGAFAGAYTTAHAGMTIRVGSTAGASDLGHVRLRDLITTTGSLAIKIGETSDIHWLADTPVAGTGTVAIAASTAVVGTGTLFTSEIDVGDVVVINGEARVVSTITDNTHLAVSVAFTTTASAQVYDIYGAPIARYLTIVDEFRIWPRLLRTVGPTTTAISGKVKYSQNTMKVYGDRDGVLWTGCDPGDGTVYLHRSALDPGVPFTSLFVAGDYVEVTWWSDSPYFRTVEVRKVISVVDGATLEVDTPFTPGLGNVFAPAYPIKTRFLTEIERGDFINIGSVSSEVTSITSDVELKVRVAFAGNASMQTATITRLRVYMDYDISVADAEYGNKNNQHNYPVPPVPIMGGPIVIDNFQENPITIQLDASESYQIGVVSTPLTYLWETTGGTLSDTAIANPTLTISAAGTYRVTCRVSGIGTPGRPAYGHRKIYVFDKAHPPVTLGRLNSIEGSVDAGGWKAGLTIYSSINSSEIWDQMQVVIFARDHYGTTRQSIGQLALSQNIIMAGWIVDESIEIDPELNTTAFGISGPQYWLEAITGVSTAMEDTSLPPSTWLQMYHLNVDRSVWHFFVWRTTLTLICDLHLTGDIRRLKFVEGKLGSLVSQVSQISKQIVLARAVADRYGRVVVEINPQYIPAASRITPVVQHFDEQDLQPLQFGLRKVNATCQITISGTKWSGTASVAFVSTYPEGVFKTHGRPNSISNLAIDNQVQADRLALLAISNDNNPYPYVPIPMLGNNRLIDISPAMYVTIDASSNPRGSALGQLPVLIMRVSHSYNPETGEMTTEASGEGYTDEDTTLDGAPPSLPFSF